MARTGPDDAPPTRGDRPTLAPWSRWALVGALVLATVAGVAAWRRDQGPDPEAFCQRLAGAAQLDDRLATDPANVAAELDALRDAAAVSPPEVAGDIEVLIAALERLEAAAQRAPADPQGGVQEELLALQGDVERLEAASQAVGSYARDTCGLTLAGTRSTGTSRPPGTSAVPTP